MFKQLHRYNISFTSIFDFITGMTKISFSDPAYGPRRFFIEVKSLQELDLKPQVTRKILAVMHSPSLFLTFTLALVSCKGVQIHQQG